MGALCSNVNGPTVIIKYFPSSGGPRIKTVGSIETFEAFRCFANKEFKLEPPIPPDAGFVVSDGPTYEVSVSPLASFDFYIPVHVDRRVDSIGPPNCAFMIFRAQ